MGTADEPSLGNGRVMTALGREMTRHPGLFPLGRICASVIRSDYWQEMAIMFRDPEMHILFVHQNFPAQFGHIARHLVKRRDWMCTFVSETPPGVVAGIHKIQYKTKGGARATTHYCSRTFENTVWHSHAVFEACKAHPNLRPDLILGHSGFGSTLFLPELYPNAKVLNYFEFYYHPHQSDMDFRPEFPRRDRLPQGEARNAMLLLDLVNCRAATVRRTINGRSSPPSSGTRSRSSSTASRQRCSVAELMCPVALGDLLSHPRPGSLPM